MIYKWWNTKKENRLNKFTQNGQWSFQVANKIFSWFLGYRIRKLLRTSSELQKLINSQKDIYRVIKEMLEQYIKEPRGVSSPKSKTPLTTVGETIDFFMFRLDKLQGNSAVLSQLGPDQAFLKSLVKELLNEREKLLKALWSDAAWVHFPRPGYWSFNAKRLGKVGIVRTRSVGAMGHGASPSPAALSSPSRPLRSLKAVQETPPHVKAATNPTALQEKSQRKKVNLGHLGKNNAKNAAAIVKESDGSLFGTPDERPEERDDHDDSELQVQQSIQPEHLATPKTVREIIDERPIKGSGGGGGGNGSWFKDELAAEAFPVGNNRPASVSIQQTNSSDGPKGKTPTTSRSVSVPAARANAQPQTAASLSAKKSKNAAPPPAPSAVRKRNGEGGHIQLEVLSGEKLIPAKKVSPSTLSVCAPLSSSSIV